MNTIKKYKLFIILFIITIFSCQKEKQSFLTVNNKKEIVNNTSFKKYIKENIKMLKSENKSERKIAVARLGALKAKESVPYLIDIIKKDKNKDVVRLAITALGDIGDPGAVNIVKEKLTTENNEIKKAAVQSIIKYEDINIITILEEILSGNDHIKKIEVLNSFSKSNYWINILSSNKKLNSYVLKAVENEDPGVRKSGIKLLGNMNNQKYFNILMCALINENNDTVKIEIIRSLNKYKSKKTIPVLKPFLKDNNKILACISACALFNMNDSEGKKIIKKLIKSEDDIIRFEIIKQLGETGGNKSINLLEELLIYEKVIGHRILIKKILRKIERKKAD